MALSLDPKTIDRVVDELKKEELELAERSALVGDAHGIISSLFSENEVLSKERNELLNDLEEMMTEPDQESGNEEEPETKPPATVTPMSDWDPAWPLPPDGLSHKRIKVRGRGLELKFDDRTRDYTFDHIEIDFDPQKNGVKGILVEGGQKIRMTQVSIEQHLRTSEAYSAYTDNELIKIEGAGLFEIDGFNLVGGTKGIELRANPGRHMHNFDIRNGRIKNPRNSHGPDDKTLEGHHLQVLSTGYGVGQGQDRHAPVRGGEVYRVKCYRDDGLFAGMDDFNFFACGGIIRVDSCDFDGQNQRSAAHVQFEASWEARLTGCFSRRAHQSAFAASGTRNVHFGDLYVEDRHDRRIVLDQEAAALKKGKCPAYIVSDWYDLTTEEFHQTGPCYADAGKLLTDKWTEGGPASALRVTRS